MRAVTFARQQVGAGPEVIQYKLNRFYGVFWTFAECDFEKKAMVKFRCRIFFASMAQAVIRHLKFPLTLL